MTRRRRVLVFAAGAAAVCGAGLVAAAPGGWAVPAARGAVRAGAARAAGSWGRAIEVPAPGALNRYQEAEVTWLSCTSPGNCAAGGDYRDQHQNSQGFVVSESKGVWGWAIEVPGLGALNKGQNAGVLSVSCASAGNCLAGGYYRHHGFQGFVVSERHGRWGRALEVPGLGALNTGGDGEVLSVSCASAGNCAAGGYYRDQHRNSQGFAVVERNGSWRKAIEVPGLGALNAGGNAGVSEVSCTSAGNCTAGGSYHDGDRHSQGFAVVEKNGRWGQAIEPPGLGALNTGGYAGVHDVSCASARSCTAGGEYADGSGSYQGFVVSENNGAWGRAMKVPGLAALNTDGDAFVWSLSCASPGNCAAGGWYQVPYENLNLTEAFVASERNGRWGRAIEVPGLAAQNNVGNASVNEVSCASPGNCTAGGYDADGQGFVVSEKNPAKPARTASADSQHFVTQHGTRTRPRPARRSHRKHPRQAATKIRA